MNRAKMADEKARLRRDLIAARNGLEPADKVRSDELISKAVQAVPEFQAADLLLSYLSFGSEVDTVALIEGALASGVRVGLPRVAGKGAMTWHEVTDLDGLVRSSFGILEPAASTPTLAMESLGATAPIALVPGLAFDGEGFRLGYGGGYYDRFLPRFREAGGVAIGLCREAAFQEHPLPRWSTDIAVDMVVTEGGERIRRI